MIQNVEIRAVSKDKAMMFLGNPYFIMGATGHIAALKVYDKITGDFVYPSQGKSLTNKFYVAYLFGSKSVFLAQSIVKTGGGVKAVTGYFEGPIYSGAGVSYKGVTLDESESFEMLFTFSSNDSTLRIILSTNQNLNVKSKVTGTELSKLSGHIINDHIFPALKQYVGDQEQEKGSSESG
ncbi:MAG: hypothetical protein QW239_06895 [Metallosphaera sp.]